MRGLVRALLGSVAVLLLLAGGVGLALAYAPEEWKLRLYDPVSNGLEAALALAPIGLESDAVLSALSGFPLRFVLAPLGLVLLVATLLPGKGGGPRTPKGEMDEEQFAAALQKNAEGDKKSARKARKEAAAIAKKGLPLEAAEICISAGLHDEAANYFIEAEEFVRAAEIRHDQNQFLESAEIYTKAGHHDAAAVIFAQQDEHARAAEAYVEAGNISLAAECFEKAGDHRRAAQSYDSADFPREAARAYAKCELWADAARCLEKEILDLGSAGGGTGTSKGEDLARLYRAAGGFYERADELAKAQAILMKGQLYEPAAEIAVRRDDVPAAVELFQKARLAPKAAKVLEDAGKPDEAARILAEYHRDRGEEQTAAEQFEAAGEYAEAADLYRLLEQYDKAGACYEKARDGAQAAEMFTSAGDRARAGENYERAGRFAEAAECFALAGDDEREAAMLEQAGSFLGAAKLHRLAGRNDEAIRTAQQVEPGTDDFANASAMLGEIFREREMYPVAIAKLEDATRDREIERDTVRAFYCLASVLEATDELDRALALFEKILGFDFHYEDVEARLGALREKAQERAAQADAATAAPSTPGRYTIRGTLGRGGMGIVYKADDTVLDRTVAFKVLPETLKENPQALANFLREAKSAAKLNHPNIVTVYDAGEQDGVFYIAMEYVDGNTLKEIIKRRGKIAPRGIVHVLAQMAEALAYAHEKKIVHRDIKTANTMWTVERKAKIMDFGLAKAIEEVRNHTTVVSGTPYYMSPEQTLGKNVDHRTDIYSLGVSIFEMATGTLPFTEGNIPYHHVHTPPPDPRELVPDLPPLLHGVIERCMRKDPGERYQSARDILTELRSSLSA
ncbi:MAG: protein kinase domain-containing protein [Myxococcota bacterium]